MARCFVRNGGQWTESRFYSFVKGALRSASMKWPPKNEVKKAARIRRGVYVCKGCDQAVPNSIKVEGKRINNVFVDHILPVIDPAVGFVSWDEVIERMFCEANGLQVLCKDCHDAKTKEEREIAKKRKQNERSK
jgi:hypothetical protein